MQHFLYFLPLPHGHGSLRPTFDVTDTIGFGRADAASRYAERSAHM